MRTSFAVLVVTVAVLAVAAGCKGKTDAAKSSAGGSCGEYHLLMEEGEADPNCVAQVIADSMGDMDLAEDVGWAAKRMSTPGVLLTHSNEQVVYELRDMFEEKCKVETTVVEGSLEWRIRVVERGVSTDCMTEVLVKMVPNTRAEDWSGKVSAGQVIHSSNDYATIARIERKLENKCGCKLDKEYVYR